MESGIYKITSPSKKIYIGQAFDIISRWKDYINYKHLNNQPRIKNSIAKYGVENHVFEVVEYCDISELDCKERYWQEYYNVLGKKGLNCILQECGEKKKEYSQQTKNKISKALLGSKRTDEQKQRLSDCKKGVKQKQETVDKRIAKIKEYCKEEAYRDKFGVSLRKKVYQYDLSGNFIKEWESGRKACRVLNMSESAVCSVLNKVANKTAGGFLWSYEKTDIVDIPKNNKKKVLMFDLNNNYLEKFDSVILASKLTNTSKSSIIRCCKNKQKTANRFIWKYLTN